MQQRPPSAKTKAPASSIHSPESSPNLIYLGTVYTHELMEYNNLVEGGKEIQGETIMYNHIF